MIKIGVVDNVCSIMSGLNIKKSITRAQGKRLHDVRWKTFGNWNVARSYWNARKSHIVSIKCKKTLGVRGS